MSEHKFSKQDKPFLDRRREFFKKYPELDSRLVVENWGLFTGTVGLGRVLALYEVVKMTLNTPGHIMEFGVYRGNSLHLFAKLLRLLSPNNYKMVYGFDSFQGLQMFSPQDGTATGYKDFYAGSQDVLKETLELHELGDMVHLVPGIIEETLPASARDHGHHVYSIVNIDTDLYQSTRLILDTLWPQVAVGGVVLLDEGYDEIFPGEGLACQEFLRAHKGEVSCGHFAFTREPMLYLQKTA